MDSCEEEQERSTVKLEFDPCIVDSSSSSEKSCTGQAQEIGEEVTSSCKRSTPLDRVSAGNLSKKPRLHACEEGFPESLGEFLDRESREVRTRTNSDADDTSLHNDDRTVADADANANDDEENDDGDDDLPDDFLEPLDSPLASSPPPSLHSQEPIYGRPSATDMAKLMFRQFWKAGDYDYAPATVDLDLATGMEHVRVHPKFLHSNATSHKWALGAIAELLDNSLDEAMNGATLVNVDMICNPRDGRPMLMVEDDGGGMDPERMRQCMSLGYSVKSKVANTIGQYGNGFKTSTMRLGADVVVFSRHKSKDGSLPTQSIGLLSYTFLTATGHDDIIVPMVDYEVHPFGLRKLVRGTLDDWNTNLKTILQWSPYNTEERLFDQFKRIDSQGTVIIVYNLWDDEEGELELDFDADPHDIQLRGANRDEKNKQMASKYPNCKRFFTYKYSLRSYASILYLRLPKRFKMFLRGEQVVHHRVVSDLMLSEQVKYKPVKVSVKSHRDAVALVTLGFVKDAKEHIDVQGFNVYYKNRLIKPFWRVWNYPGIHGRGVFGVLEANFVEPAHDKQGFERTTVFARLEARLIEIQKSYWSRNCGHIGYVGYATKKKAPSKSEGAGAHPSYARPAYPGTPHMASNTRASLSPSTTKKGNEKAHVVLREEPLQAGRSISLEKCIDTASVLPNEEQRGLSVPTQKISPMAIVVSDKERPQAAQGQCNSSLSMEGLPSQNTKDGHAIRAASHVSPVLGNIGRASSTLSPAELDTEEDNRSMAILHISTAVSMPSVSIDSLVPECVVKAESSGLPDTSRRVEKVEASPSACVTGSQALGGGKVEEVLSPSVRTMDPAHTHKAEGLSSNGNDLACGAHSSLGGNGVDCVSRSDEPSRLHSLSVAEDPVSLNASPRPPLVSLMSESLQDSSEVLISPTSQFEAPESSLCTSNNATNGSLTSAQTQEGHPRLLTRSMLQLQQSHAKAARQQESVNAQPSGHTVVRPLINSAVNGTCLTRTMPEEGDTSVTTLVAHAAEHSLALDSIDSLEEKLGVMKGQLRSLQGDLDQIYSERDHLKGELEEERKRQSVIEEELRKKLQALSSKARELEAANKLLQVCQR